MPSGSASTRSTICVHGLALDRQAGGRRIGHADAREQQAQVVVDLGDRADGGARVLGGGLLLDGDGRRQPVDVVDVGLLHHLQELARVGRQALDVAALALGIDGVEGERGLARARQPREHDQRVARDLEVDVLQVVLARAADVDGPVGLARGTDRADAGLGGLAHECGSSSNGLEQQSCPNAVHRPLKCIDEFALPSLTEPVLRPTFKETVIAADRRPRAERHEPLASTSKVARMAVARINMSGGRMTPPGSRTGPRHCARARLA